MEEEEEERGTPFSCLFLPLLLASSLFSVFLSFPSLSLFRICSPPCFIVPFSPFLSLPSSLFPPPPFSSLLYFTFPFPSLFPSLFTLSFHSFPHSLSPSPSFSHFPSPPSSHPLLLTLIFPSPPPSSLRGEEEGTVIFKLHHGYSCYTHTHKYADKSSCSVLPCHWQCLFWVVFVFVLFYGS